MNTVTNQTAAMLAGLQARKLGAQPAAAGGAPVAAAPAPAQGAAVAPSTPAPAGLPPWATAPVDPRAAAQAAGQTYAIAGFTAQGAPVYAHELPARVAEVAHWGGGQVPAPQPAPTQYVVPHTTTVPPQQYAQTPAGPVPIVGMNPPEQNLPPAPATTHATPTAQPTAPAAEAPKRGRGRPPKTAPAAAPEQQTLAGAAQNIAAQFPQQPAPVASSAAPAVTTPASIPIELQATTSPAVDGPTITFALKLSPATVAALRIALGL